MFRGGGASRLRAFFTRTPSTCIPRARPVGGADEIGLTALLLVLSNVFMTFA